MTERETRRKSERETRPVPTEVPPGVEPAARCPYCDRPFTNEHRRDLHVGERHEEALTDVERKRYEEAIDRDGDELFILHLKIVAGLVLSFFAIAYLYAFILT